MPAYVPKAVSRDDRESSAKLPRNPGQSRYPFYLQLHPREWEWERGAGWFPSVGRLAITPGSMGVQNPPRQGDPVDPAPAILNAERQGWVVLKAQEEYLCYLDVEGGGRCYFTKWDSPDVYYKSVSWDHDAAGLRAFVMSKVGSGPGKLIPACPERLRERKIAAFRKRLERLELMSTTNPNNGSMAQRFKQAQLQLRAMVAELAGEPFEHIEAGTESAPEADVPVNPPAKAAERSSAPGAGAGKGKGSKAAGGPPAPPAPPPPPPVLGGAQ